MPQDMELSEFVSKTIIDIAKGLETAAEVLSDSDIIITLPHKMGWLSV